MTTYELTYIVSPEITSEEAEAKSKDIESLIQSKEGTIVKQNNPIAKTLAYPVAKKASGFLGILEFQLEPEKLIELKEIIRKDGKIVRHMVIIKELAKPKKMRRAKIIVPETIAVKKTENEPEKEEKLASAKSTIEKEKVELKDIDQQLDEILG